MFRNFDEEYFLEQGWKMLRPGDSAKEYLKCMPSNVCLHDIENVAGVHDVLKGKQECYEQSNQQYENDQEYVAGVHDVLKGEQECYEQSNQQDENDQEYYDRYNNPNYPEDDYPDYPEDDYQDYPEDDYPDYPEDDYPDYPEDDYPEDDYPDYPEDDYPYSDEDEDECIVGKGGGICPCCGGLGDPNGRNARRQRMFSIVR
jgi:hypothetical protein